MCCGSGNASGSRAVATRASIGVGCGRRLHNAGWGSMSGRGAADARGSSTQDRRLPGDLPSTADGVAWAQRDTPIPVE